MDTYYINLKRVNVSVPAHIVRLEGVEMSRDWSIADAYIRISDGIISEVGSMNEFVAQHHNVSEQLSGCEILPAYVDSHTHIIFAATREEEFVMKLQGKSYQEIAQMGGGILNSAHKLSEMDPDSLYQSAHNRLLEMIRMGTGAVEIKSGYGLSVEAELKMLRVIKKLKSTFNIPIKATFLGAHAIPKSFSDADQYISQVVLPTLDAAVAEGLVDFVDIFIEHNYFSLKDAHQILDYADNLGIRSKLHVNQLSNFGALQLAVDRGALSADHLEEMTDNEIKYLKDKSTIGTLLPSCSFFLKIPYAPARRMIDSGLAIALASDFNPGSTPSGNMNFVQSLACIQQRLMPIEALHAATINGAYAMGIHDRAGRISVGYLANLIVLEPKHTITSISYHFGHHLIERMMINGHLIDTNHGFDHWAGRVYRTEV